MSEMRDIAKELAKQDRQYKKNLVARRRESGLRQYEVDIAAGWEDGGCKAIEAYDHDPTLSQLRRYKAIIMMTEINPNFFKGNE